MASLVAAVEVAVKLSVSKVVVVLVLVLVVEVEVFLRGACINKINTKSINKQQKRRRKGDRNK